MLTGKFRRISVFIFLSAFIFTACLRDPDPLPSAWDVMSGQSQLSTFLEAATIAEFDDDFKNSLGLTIFAPNNAAFEAWFDTLGASGLIDVGIPVLQDMVRYHLIQGAATVADLGTNYYLTPAGVGPDFAAVAILVQDTDGTVKLNNDAEIITRDLEAQNTFIHITDKVLKIPTTLDLLLANEEFTELAEGIRKAGLNGILSGDEAHTLLAPPNAAFENNLPQLYLVDKVSDMDADDIDSLFRYHVIKEFLPQEVLATSLDTRFDTYLNNRQVSIVDFGGGHIINDSIGFLLSNIQGRNGVIHFVNNVVHHK